MKLRNKKTGEIVIANVTRVVSGVDFDCGQTLAELNEEWEDYEEPHEPYRLTPYGEVVRFSSDGISNAHKRECVNIGNYFSTREEAEKAVEKLKAWKRLKDAGFRFYEKWDSKSPEGPFYYVNIFAKIDPVPNNTDFMKDLDLLFGGEE